MRYKIVLILCLFGLWTTIVSAQQDVAWIEPDPTTINFDPNQEVKIYFDVTQSEFCSELATLNELYMWTWLPNELPAGNEKANGTWDASNSLLQLTNEGDGVFSYTMVPTEFYEVSAEEVYENDFAFLVKANNGAGGATGCPEDKTEDLIVEAEPVSLVRKVFSFPDIIDDDTLATRSTDIFTFIYDNKLEEKEGLDSASDFNVFAKAIGTNGVEYTYASPAQLDNFPELDMVPVGDDVYHWYIIPDRFFADLLPDGVYVESLKLQVAREGARSTADLVDGTFFFHFKCN